ncbi:MAG: hypothetical protein ACK5V3_09630 [Bdellovibrionales bacterium]
MIEKKENDLTCHKISKTRLFLSQDPLIARINMAWDYSRLSYDGSRIGFPSIKDSCLFSSELDWSLLTGSPLEKYYFSEQKSHMVHTFYLNPEFSDLDQVKGFERIKREYEERREATDLTWTGIGALEYFTWKGIEHSKIQNAIVVVIVFALFWWLHGNWLSGLIFWFTVFTTLTFVYGGMAALGQKQDVLSICLFLMLTVACLEDYLFVCHHKKFGTSDWYSAFKDLERPSFLTSLTTAVGFGSLAFSELNAIKWFGIWAAFGALMEWFIVFKILPIIMQKYRWLQFVPKHRKFSGFTGKFLIHQLPKWVSLSTLLIFILPFFGPKIELTQSPEKTFPKNHELRRGIEFASGTMGWRGVIELVFPFGEKPVEVFHKLNNSQSVFAVMDAQGILDEQMNQKWRLSLQEEIKRLFTIMPESQHFYSRDKKQERAYVFVKNIDIHTLNNLRMTINEKCQNRCFLTGELIGFADQSNRILKTLFTSFWVSLILIVLLILIIGWRRGHRWQIVPIIASSVWGPFAILCLLNFSGIEINFVTCIVLSVLNGLTGDNAIQYLYAGSNLQKSSQKMGLASLWVAITMVIVSSLFLFSYFEPPRYLGLLMALGFVFSFFGDYFLLRSWIKNKSFK